MIWHHRRLTQSEYQHLVILLGAIDKKLVKIMSQQDELNTAAQEIEADVQLENAALARIQAEIAQLEAAVANGQTLDFSGLKQAVADAGAAAAAEDAVVPPPAP